VSKCRGAEDGESHEQPGRDISRGFSFKPIESICQADLGSCQTSNNIKINRTKETINLKNSMASKNMAVKSRTGFIEE
jgi:hypothetical protein